MLPGRIEQSSSLRLVRRYLWGTHTLQGDQTNTLSTNYSHPFTNKAHKNQASYSRISNRSTSMYLAVTRRGAEVLHHCAYSLIDGAGAEVFDWRRGLSRLCRPVNLACLRTPQRLGSLDLGSAKNAMHPLILAVVLQQTVKC